MSTGPRSRHGGPGSAGPSPAGCTTAPTSGDGSCPHLPCTPAGAVAFPDGLPRTPERGTTRHPLTGADLYDWMALRRVSAGGIGSIGDHWLEYGRQIPGYVSDTLAWLCDSDAVVLAERDGSGMQRAALTEAGNARFQQLCRQRQAAQRPPFRGSVDAGAWLADHPCAERVVQSVWDALTDLEQSCDHPGPITALRRVLIDHQPTPTGRCRACRRWRGRRRRFPCIVWHQIHVALQTPSSRSVPVGVTAQARLSLNASCSG